MFDVVEQVLHHATWQEYVMTDQNYFAHESAYVDDGAVIGEGTKIWHFSHILSDRKSVV